MKISMKIFAAGLALGMMCQTAAAQLPKLNIKQLRKQAEKEYLKPVSPGYEGKHPFWNVYSTKFIYASFFDVDSAVCRRLGCFGPTDYQVSV